ncbi:uncharacterized protein LOC135120409 isoform X2 [Zophobas morio]|uniref:uncharacterized protein LOC135120409 isoform X2 n=1 Tax=Zophobas morio TaxID=2755281 RepID=UPI003083128A
MEEISVKLEELMTTTSGLFTNHLDFVTSLQSSKGTGPINAFKVDNIDGQDEISFVTALEMKYLLDLPDLIAEALEQKNLTAAAILFLTETPIAKFLLDGSLYNETLLKRFPFIPLQCDALSSVKLAIINKGTSLVKGESGSVTKTCDFLVALALLQGTGPRETFQTLLSNRLLFLQEVVLNNSSSSALAQCLRCIVNTVLDSFLMFFKGFYRTKLTEALATPRREVLLRHFPDTLYATHYEELCSVAPWLDEGVNALLGSTQKEILNGRMGDEETRHLLNTWLSECVKLANKFVPEMLKTVSSCSELYRINKRLQTEYWALAVEFERCEIGNFFLELNDEAKYDWDYICNCVLGSQFDILLRLFRPHLLHRLSCSIHQKFAAVAQAISSELELLFRESGSSSWDVGSFCCEDGSDLEVVLPFENSASPSNYKLRNFSTLTLKRLGLSPPLQRLLLLFDSRLMPILADVLDISAGEDYANPPEEPIASSSHIASLVREACLELLRSLQDLLIPIINDGIPAETNKMNRVIFIGRVCHEIARHSCALPECFTTNFKIEELPEARREFLRYKHLTALEQDYHSDFKEAVGILTESFFTCLDTWSSAVVNMTLSTLNSLTSLYLSESFTSTWKVIKVTEEDEEGRQVESLLSMPTECTPVVYALFQTICIQVKNSFGFALDDITLQRLKTTILKGYTSHYSNFLKINKISEKSAIQMYVDFLFASATLKEEAALSDSDKTQLEKTLSKILDHVDPFDLKLLHGLLVRTVHVCLLKTSNLFGVLGLANRLLVEEYYSWPFFIHLACKNIPEASAPIEDGDAAAYIAEPKTLLPSLHIPLEQIEVYNKSLQEEKLALPLTRSEDYTVFSVEECLGSPDPCGFQEDSGSLMREVTSEDRLQFINEKGREMMGKFQNLAYVNHENIKKLLWGEVE